MRRRKEEGEGEEEKKRRQVGRNFNSPVLMANTNPVLPAHFKPRAQTRRLAAKAHNTAPRRHIRRADWIRMSQLADGAPPGLARCAPTSPRAINQTGRSRAARVRITNEFGPRIVEPLLETGRSNREAPARPIRRLPSRVWPNCQSQTWR